MALKILILDDDPHLGHSMHAYFQNKGVTCTLVENVEQAEQATARESFPVALVDLVLGQNSGFRFVEFFKKNTPTR
ncbi:MAG: response regulator [Calditrichaeota bacterium]|nr:MAG: response regulator [Calditrichota bacterium]